MNNLFCYIFFCKQKTAYEVRISDWSSDVCSSDLGDAAKYLVSLATGGKFAEGRGSFSIGGTYSQSNPLIYTDRFDWRSEEHTSELQSLMRISYAVFCLKKKNKVYTKSIVK